MRQMAGAPLRNCRRAASSINQHNSSILRATQLSGQADRLSMRPGHSRPLFSTSRAQFGHTQLLGKEILAPETFYEMFPQSLPAGAPPRGPFSVDEKQLRKEFLQLQALAHPDRHPQEAKNRAEAASAKINEAYKTLQSPLPRAQYLLSLRGLDVAEDETAKSDDAELLMEVLEMRENIEAAQEEADLISMKETNDARVEESVQNLDNAFKADDVEKAKQEAIKLRYWINIRESLNSWEPGKPVVLIH
jgi:molecular chaperone HscB